MKRTNLIFYISTALFAGFMMMSAIPDILQTSEASVFITALGYPQYIVPFLGVAKALGSIALFIPGFPRVTEWAYAGLTYDLIGATYSNIAANGVDPGMIFMVVIFGMEALSYIYYHKRLSAKAAE